MIYAGLSLFGENLPGQRNLRFGHCSLLIDHFAEHGISGLVTLIGVRATMARGMAEKAVDLVLKKLAMTAQQSLTDLTPIHGGKIDRYEDFVRDATSQYEHV